jgi:hypothetical protein
MAENTIESGVRDVEALNIAKKAQKVISSVISCSRQGWTIFPHHDFTGRLNVSSPGDKRYVAEIHLRPCSFIAAIAAGVSSAHHHCPKVQFVQVIVFVFCEVRAKVLDGNDEVAKDPLCRFRLSSGVLYEDSRLNKCHGEQTSLTPIKSPSPV